MGGDKVIEVVVVMLPNPGRVGLDAQTVIIQSGLMVQVHQPAGVDVGIRSPGTTIFTHIFGIESALLFFRRHVAEFILQTWCRGSRYKRGVSVMS